MAQPVGQRSRSVTCHDIGGLIQLAFWETRGCRRKPLNTLPDVIAVVV